MDGGGETWEGLDAKVRVSSGAALGFDEVGSAAVEGGGGDGENGEE